MNNFKQDINHFKQNMFSNNSFIDVKKDYLRLIKKYHPDVSDEENKQLYQEYTKEIISIYKDFINGITDELELQPQGLYSDKIKNNTFYYLLMDIARKQYLLYKKNAIKNRWSKNYEQKKYLKNAIRCYEIVIQECKDNKIIKAARMQLDWIKPLYDIQNNYNDINVK